MPKKNQQLSNNALATLVVAALLVSVVGIFLVSSRGFQLTGAQTSTPNGTVQFTLQQVASLKFAVATVNFGTGFVNTSAGNTECRMDTEGVNPESLCKNFTTVNTPLILENDGTINVTVHLRSNATAAQFIGGTNPAFKWKIENHEPGSCQNLTNTTTPASYSEVNTSSPGTLICNVNTGGIGGLNFLNDKDTLKININVTIPYDALAGVKQALLIATGTAV